MKLLLILLLIGLYSCEDNVLCKGPYVILTSEGKDSKSGKYKYTITDGCRITTDNIIYSDSLYRLGDTLKLVKQ